ncbi:MAG: hypothetical protein KGH94_04535 [Candidatus Micrarchaeota archaeon]|nr:hypothetical protein [Candidatus Micrarchaeota archaeon]
MSQQMRASELRSTLFIIILMASLIMFAGSVYMVKQIAEIYGAGAGAVLQTRSDGAQIAQSLQPISSNLGLFHIGAVMSYVLSIIAIILFGSALLMVGKRKDEDATHALTYGLLNSTFLGIYVIIIAVILSYFYSYLSASYLLVIYGGIALGAVANGYLQYELRAKPSVHLMSASISIDPSTPFSNMINLQDEIFSKMGGHLRVIDKHFNSAALTNLSRLIEGYAGNLSKITVITSKEMQDSKFSLNASEFEKEMQGRGVPTEIRVMDPKDSAEQHERLLMDDQVAYKIPPFSIINRKSEHITKVKAAEARARFHLLYARAQKI